MCIRDSSKGLLKDRDKEKSKQDAEDQKIKEIVDGKKDSTKKKDPFAKLGE